MSPCEGCEERRRLLGDLAVSVQNRNAEEIKTKLRELVTSAQKDWQRKIADLRAPNRTNGFQERKNDV